ncbi:glycosyltransferase [Oscillatoria amoena NRMC-F 0135]|nr:glycosyltransferase [Geitlerinema splendidum]MDL5046837.1 glycosyltransferase [Oscillatoria amoena NRMC-F 0135]
MRVLHVIPSVSPHRGGPSRVAINLVKHLREQGVEAEIATTNDDGSGSDAPLAVPVNCKSEYEGVPVWFFPLSASPRQNVTLGRDRGFLFSADLTQWLWNHIRSYDILDNHYLFSYASSCAGAIARWQNVPYTVRTMGQLAPWALAQSRRKKQLYAFLLERRNLNRAAAVHCTSAGEVTDVRNFGVTAPTLTLPLGVEFSQPLPDAKQKLRARYQLPGGVPLILFLSRLHYKKRPDLLLQALHQLGSQTTPFHLLLAGSGEPDYLETLKDLVSGLGLAERTTFTGFVAGEDKDLVLQGSDLFVLPSFSENFGIAVAEAMAAGLPVLIAPEVQIAPDIAQAQAGLVVEGTVSAFAEAIAHLLNSQSDRVQLGRNGVQYAQQHYTWSAIATQLANSYQSLKCGGS